MESKNNGGQAFPLPVAYTPLGKEVPSYPGMTLRDYFAAKALIALFSGEANPRVGREVEPYNSSPSHRDWSAKEAYALADAMLAARGAA